MKDFVIFGDSTCDLDLTTRQQWNIDYIPMTYTVDDQEYPASLDWESHGVKEYYDLMRSGKRVYTAQIAINVCREKFLAAIEAGKDVVYIACSSALSSSYQTACVIARELEESHPGAKIYCVDALISILGQGLLVVEAARQRQAGKSAEETAAYIESIRLNVNMVGYPGSLEYLRRAGRVKASSAFFGNLFGVKPILISDRQGNNYALKKVKGIANARNAVVEMVLEAATEETDTLYLVHADCEAEANAIRDAVLSRRSFDKVITGTIGPIVGASVGPGMVGAFLYGKEVTIEGND
jgi:DegV family protein with EDD domain